MAKRSREIITTQDLINLKRVGILNFAALARAAGIKKALFMAYTNPFRNLRFHSNLARNERLRRVLVQILKELDTVLEGPITSNELLRLKLTGFFVMSRLAKRSGVGYSELIMYTYPRRKQKFTRKEKRNEKVKRALEELRGEIQKAIGYY